MTTITNHDEILIRQIASYHINAGRVEFKAFRPRPTKDFGKLSTSMESGIQAQEAYDHYVTKGQDSVGVAKLSVKEVMDQNLLAAHSPLTPQDCAFNIHHSHIDFTQCQDHNAAAKDLLKIVLDNSRYQEMTLTGATVPNTATSMQPNVTP